MKSKFDKLIDSYMRKGLMGRVDYLKRLDKLVLNSHKKQIFNNDKSVLRELILPSWIDWETLRIWVQRDEEATRNCLFCKKTTEKEFKGKSICDKCISAIKKLKK